MGASSGMAKCCFIPEGGMVECKMKSEPCRSKVFVEEDA
jgi:hypothetical protein